MVALTHANHVNFFDSIFQNWHSICPCYNRAMNLSFFADPDLVPKPREEVQLESLDLSPYPDGRRVKVTLTITPFMPMDRPSLEILVNDENDNLVSSLNIVETNTHILNLTVHLRTVEQPRGQYTFRVDLYYDDDLQHSILQSIRLPDDLPVTG